MGRKGYQHFRCCLLLPVTEQPAAARQEQAELVLSEQHYLSTVCLCVSDAAGLGHTPTRAPLRSFVTAFLSCVPFWIWEKRAPRDGCADGGGGGRGGPGAGGGGGPPRSVGGGPGGGGGGGGIVVKATAARLSSWSFSSQQVTAAIRRLPSLIMTGQSITITPHLAHQRITGSSFLQPTATVCLVATADNPEFCHIQELQWVSRRRLLPPSSQVRIPRIFCLVNLGSAADFSNLAAECSKVHLLI
jgi:hypothetical protein